MEKQLPSFFTYRDIMSILDLPKHRYEQAMFRVGIRPEIKEVSGRGKTNQFSFRNLLQFAFVNTGLELGLSAQRNKGMLDQIDHLEQNEKIGIFDPQHDLQMKIHYIVHNREHFFKVSGASLTAQLQKSSFPKKGKKLEALIMMGTAIRDKRVTFPKGTSAFAKEAMEMISQQDLCQFHSVISVNLGSIKREILNTIRAA